MQVGNTMAKLSLVVHLASNAAIALAREWRWRRPLYVVKAEANQLKFV